MSAAILVPHAFQLTVSSIDTLIFSVNYFLAFVMLADPKTSPHKKSHQVIFGASIAVLIAVLGLLRLTSPLLLALLVANLGYSISKRYFQNAHHQAKAQNNKIYLT